MHCQILLLPSYFIKKKFKHLYNNKNDALLLLFDYESSVIYFYFEKRQESSVRFRSKTMHCKFDFLKHFSVLLGFLLSDSFENNRTPSQELELL